MNKMIELVDFFIYNKKQPVEFLGPWGPMGVAMGIPGGAQAHRGPPKQGRFFFT